MTTQLLLTRHGETVANAARKYSGHTDVMLSALGRRQARALGRRLRDEHIDAAYASDLIRARETAEYVVLGRGIGVCCDPGLRELCFGEWEGRTFEEVRRVWPDAWSRLLNLDDDFCAPGGELFSDARGRVAAALERIVQAHPDQSVLVVAHGGSLQMILSHVLGTPVANTYRVAAGNCGLSIVEYRGGRPIVTLVNDCAHTVARRQRAKR